LLPLFLIFELDKTLGLEAKTIIYHLDCITVCEIFVVIFTGGAGISLLRTRGELKDKGNYEYINVREIFLYTIAFS
jgi:hypothetical protein